MTTRTLACRFGCEAIIYADYPAVEWVVYFQNNGDRDTPIIEDILAMDVSFTRPGPGDPTYIKRWIEWKGEAETVAVHREPGEFVVHHATGGIHSFWAFQPHDDELGPGQELTIGGVSSQPDLPFFNVEWPDEGIVAGIGWTAPWRADFVRDQERSLRVNVAMTEWVAPWRADAMGGAHLSLRPGERIRIPRVLMMFWDQDRLRAQNRWRRLLFDHYSPRPDSELVKMPFGAATQWHTEEQNIAIINWHLDNGIPIEDFWMDIGWQRAPTEEEAFEHLADDVVNENLFPNGIQAVSDAAHKRGVKYLLWFGGDERCRFQAIYPYLERVRKYRPELLSDEYPGVDNGNPMINQWMIDHYGQQIENLGIDIFRWDSRSTPPPDTDNNRRGVNWARSAEGFYKFWDALLERFPGLIIDCCGGGAVNMDLETVQRSVFLHRCDYQCGGIHEPENVFNPTGMQGQTHGVSSWAPLTSGCPPIEHLRLSEAHTAPDCESPLKLSLKVFSPLHRPLHRKRSLMSNSRANYRRSTSPSVTASTATTIRSVDITLKRTLGWRGNSIAPTSGKALCKPFGGLKVTFLPACIDSTD